MKKGRGWETRIHKILYNEMFLPRMGRITSLLKGKSPRRITAKQKSRLRRKIEPHIIKALKGRYKEDIVSRQLKPIYLKGEQPEEQIRKILDKFRRNDPDAKKFIYTLWENKLTCLYVGQTKVGPKEITLKNRTLLKRSRFLKVFEISRKTHLDKYEGIALHVFAPKNKLRPQFNKAHPKNADNCPFCQMNKRVKREINNSLVLSKRSRA
jgi:hypothetical protein